MRKVLRVVFAGAVIALIPLLPRLARKMRAHCEQMANRGRDLTSKGQRNETARAGPPREEVERSDRRLEGSLR